MAKVAKKVTYSNAWYTVAAARLLLGIVFLWAFLDKTFGLGFATKGAGSWVSGGSPTSGFLLHGVNPNSPFAHSFASLSGQAWVDWVFMIGLLCIGLSLILGIGVRIAAISGTLLLGLMWVASLPLANNPFIDEHIIYIAVLWIIALSPRQWSVAGTWVAQPYVKKNPWLW